MQTLREVMTTELFTCSPQDPVSKAAKMMRDHNVGAVPVCDGPHLLGMLTDRDICIRCVALDKPGTTACHDVMSDRKLVVGHPDMSVDEAAQLMADEKIRRLPVVDNNRLVGLVAIGDLAVRDFFEDEAGEALSEISEPSRPV